ncbi:hypothetical protein GCM10011584_25360 [Nocardioides phosphati]|uniref:Uncharacterized protein n=1 Tax=Nocardioides phosphati TaxID=1867775 RepID=A0ABQ2ND32_9ACTN|nr:hypothetical protein [Nocardioides phosphati]GGO91393.1 hypothetical protein GCM10011584_25360 [Nocardioides phosphati]
MKALLLGLLLLGALTGFSLLPTAEAPAPAPYVADLIAPGPALPTPEWSIQPIPTDGWDDGPAALPGPDLPPLAPPHERH